MKKYTIWTDDKTIYCPTTVYTEEEAIAEFENATQYVNRSLNLGVNEHYFGYNARFEGDKDLSFEEWVKDTDVIYCDIEEV